MTEREPGIAPSKTESVQGRDLLALVNKYQRGSAKIVYSRWFGNRHSGWTQNGTVVEAVVAVGPCPEGVAPEFGVSVTDSTLLQDGRRSYQGDNVWQLPHAATVAETPEGGVEIAWGEVYPASREFPAGSDQFQLLLQAPAQ